MLNYNNFLKFWKSSLKHFPSSKNICPALGSIQFWSPTSTPTTSILQSFAIIAAAVIVALFVYSKLRKDKDEPMMMELDDADLIDAIIKRAGEVQARFDIICTRPGLEHRHLQGYCHPSINAKINPKSPSDANEPSARMILDLHAGGIVKGWDNAPIDVYFMLNENDVSTLYHFASFVCDIRKKGMRTILEISRPSILSDSKAKDTVRIEPTPEMIALASVWFYHTTSIVLPQSVSKLGRAHAVFRPSGNSDFRVISVSASRFRLRFLRDALEATDEPLKKGHQICMLLAINTKPKNLNNSDSPKEEDKMLLWLKGVCIGFAPCLEKDCLDALFNFTHWQEICQRSDEIKWYPATDAERVPPLMHWIMNAENKQESSCEPQAQHID